MGDDVIRRLRELAAHNRRTNPGLPDDFVMLGDEAADRIEELEAALDRLSPNLEGEK